MTVMRGCYLKYLLSAAHSLQTDISKNQEHTGKRDDYADAVRKAGETRG